MDKKEKSRRRWEFFLAIIGIVGSGLFASYLSNLNSNTAGGIKHISNFVTIQSNWTGPLFNITIGFGILMILYIIIRVIDLLDHLDDFWDLFS